MGHLKGGASAVAKERKKMGGALSSIVVEFKQFGANQSLNSERLSRRPVSEVVTWQISTNLAGLNE